MPSGAVQMVLMSLMVTMNHSLSDQEGAEGLGEHAQEEHCNVADEEGDLSLGDLADFQFTHRAGDLHSGEDVDSHGRGHGTDDVGDAQDHAKVDDVDAHALGDRPQNGDQQNCDGGAFHEGAEDQQDDGHDQAEQGLVQVHGDDQLHQSSGSTGEGEHPGECGGSCDDKQDHGSALSRLHQDGDQVGDLDFLVDEHTGDESPHAGHSSGLGSGQQAGVDAAQDDNRGHQSRHSLQEDLADLTGGMLGLSLGPLFLVGIVQSFQDQDDHDQDADDHALAEHVGDGRTGQGAVQHHDDGRGNDRAQAAGDDQQTGGAVLRVALLDHVSVQHGADSDDGCGSGTGQSSEEGTGDDQSHAHAAADVADEAVCKVDDTTGNAAACHQIASQDKEGDGHDGGGLQAAEHALCDNGRRNAQVAQSHSGQRADAQGHGNGDSDQNADCEDQKQDNASIHDHFASFFLMMPSMMASMLVMSLMSMCIISPTSIRIWLMTISAKEMTSEM